MDFQLSLYAPLASGTAVPVPLAQMDLSQPDIGISWTTNLPGGFGALTVNLPAPNMPLASLSMPSLPTAIPLPYRQPRIGNRWNLRRAFMHGVLTAGGQVAYEGALTQLVAQGPEPTQLVFQGYGISAVADNPYYSADTTMYTTGVVLQDAITKTAPRLVLPNNPVIFGDPGIAHAPNEFQYQTVGTMLQQFATEGDQDGNLWDFTVYEGRVARWQARIPPSMPDYLVPLDQTVEWREDYTNLYGQVQTVYNLAGTSTQYITPALPDNTFPERFGFMRTVAINGSTMTQAGAQAFATSYQAYHTRYPDYAITINWNKQVRREEADRGLVMPSGQEMPAWMVRAGQWVQVEDAPNFIITRTQHDYGPGASNTLQAKLGEFAADTAEIFQFHRKAVQHLRKRTNVLTGAPILG